MKRLPVHTLYTFAGNDFTAHCGLEFRAADINDGTVKVEVIDSTATLREIRKITCIACMMNYNDSTISTGWKDYSKITTAFDEKIDKSYQQRPVTGDCEECDRRDVQLSTVPSGIDWPSTMEVCNECVNEILTR